MFHRVRNVYPLEDYRLMVQFIDGTTRIYDVKHLCLLSSLKRFYLMEFLGLPHLQKLIFVHRHPLINHGKCSR